ncbi:MAG TPA: FecR domain-containing protein [Opitutaceae bacterium]|nr:FecR domain-containing protein [Opitutaceae bacterium]
MSSENSRTIAAEEQASLWAARLEGEDFSAADRRALEAWLAEAPEHRALLSEYCQFSADLEETLPALVAAGSIEMPALAAAGHSRRWWKSPWKIGAGLALGAAAASLAFALWFAQPHNQHKTVATSVAQRQSLTLDDGTRIELNAQTSLLVENTRAERRVRLADGEIFLTVSKDKSRPFFVETPNGSVRVTGTVFDVRSEGNAALSVTVVEGSVQVRPGEFSTGRASSPVSLTAGDQLSASAHGVEVTNLPASAVEDQLAWRQGQVVFDGVPLREALARFAHYHGRGITAAPGAAELKVGGRFSLDDIDGFFSALETVLPVKVTHDLSGASTVSLREDKS